MMNDTKKQNSISRLPRNVWVMSATSLLNIIPFFLANILSVRTTVIGLIEGIAETTASLLKILFGALSDKLRKRKPFTVIAYALSAFTKPFLYFAGTSGWVLGVRVADRIGKGVRTAPRDALIAGFLWQGAGSWMGFGASAPFFFGAAMVLLAGLLFLRLVK